MSIFSDFFSLLYPELCPICGEALISGEKILCTSCFYKLPKTDFHLDDKNPIHDLFLGRINLQDVAAYLYFKKGAGYSSLFMNLSIKVK